MQAQADTSCKSLWQETCSERFESQRIEGNIDSDVAVIGGGYTGLRAAIELAQAGSSVIVLEAGEIGSGASGLNGGQVNPMLPVALPQKLRKAVGDKWFERMTAASLRSADDLFAFIRENSISCDARQKGWLRAQHSEKAKRTAIEAAREWNKHGAKFEIMDGDAVNRLAGTSAYVGGVVTPDGGAIHPLKLVNGMANVATGLGVKIFCNTRVSALTRVDGNWQLRAANANVRADAVIVATNGYTDSLVPRLKSSILPMNPVQIATGPLDAKIADTLLPEGHTISDTQKLIMYCRKEPDNRFVYGGIGYLDRKGRVRGFDWLREDAVRIFPQLRGVRFSCQWSGRIALTDDRVPHFHEPEPGLFVGLGYNGRGVAISQLMGKNLAQRALGTMATKLDFPSINIKPYRFGRVQNNGASLAIRFMRIQDRMAFRC